MTAARLLPTNRAPRYHEDDAACVAVALGANLGDAVATLAAARDEIAATDGVQLHRLSRLVTTEPVGGPEQPAYTNAVLIASCELTPAELLARLQAIEAAHGRTREVRWGARTLDLDLVQYGNPTDGSDVLSDDPLLTLPHPRAHERAFVLAPWLDAEPEAVLRLPDGSVRPVAELLAELDRSGVRPGPVWPDEGGRC